MATMAIEVRRCATGLCIHRASDPREGDGDVVLLTMDVEVEQAEYLFSNQASQAKFLNAVAFLCTFGVRDGTFHICGDSETLKSLEQPLMDAIRAKVAQ